MPVARRVKPSLIAVAAVVTMGAMLALPASASFDHHFAVVIGKARYSHVAENKFRAKATDAAARKAAPIAPTT
ncbi:MAG: hypothetical protein ACRDMH_05015 [Solirubrobacterales bacterium]